MTQLLARLDLCVVVLYLAAMLYIAWRVSDGSRDVEGYTVGNRGLGGWVVGLSVLGTFTSSITFLGLPAKAYADNWNAYVFSLAMPPAALLAVACFIPLYRSHTSLSAYEFLEQRFGYWARLYAAVSYVVLQLIRTATVLLLVALACSPILGWDVVATILLVGGLVIVYDVLGGIQAVIWTDVWQVVVLSFGALWCVTAILLRLPDGPMSLWDVVPAQKFSLGPLASTDLSAATILVVFVYGLTEHLRNYGTDQSYVQRMLCARSTADASRAIWLGALSYVPLSILFFLIGTGLYAHYHTASGLLPAHLKADEVFPHFIKHELPPVISGLVVAAILAAAMSTIDSSMNAVSTVVLVDFVRRFRRGQPRWPEIITLRLATIAFGLAGTGLAAGLWLSFQHQSRVIMDVWWQYAGTAGGGLFGLFLLAWLLPHVPSWGAALAVLATLPVLVWGTFARNLSDGWAWLQCPLHPFLVGVSGTAALLAVGIVLALLTRAGLIAPNPRSQAATTLEPVR